MTDNSINNSFVNMCKLTAIKRDKCGKTLVLLLKFKFE